MKEIIEYFTGEGNGINFFTALLIIGAIVAVCEKVFGWFGCKLKKLYDIKKGKETLEETICSHTSQIEEIKEDVIKLVSTINSLEEKIDQYSTQQHKVNTVLLRDKLYSIYKETIRKGYILDKDKKNFNYAYDEYIANGGNSYIVNEVAPFIHNAKVFLTDEEANNN